MSCPNPSYHPPITSISHCREPALFTLAPKNVADMVNINRLRVNRKTKLKKIATNAGGDDGSSDRTVGNDRNHHRPKNDCNLVKRMSMMILPPKGAAFASLSVADVVGIVRRHHLPTLFTVSLLFFMGVEYTLKMTPFDCPPLDIGFIYTRSLHGFIAARPALNSVLAALNTVFVLMQTSYILWTLLMEGRPRPAIAALFMFTCRGILGSSTQLPLPKDFLGSGMDFPVGNVSFFLFFSGHMAGAVIASMDMRRMERHQMARTFDVLNALQGLRLLATRGHYTIDLGVGIGAGILFDSLAGWYEKSKNLAGGEYQLQEVPCSCCCGCRCR